MNLHEEIRKTIKLAYNSGYANGQSEVAREIFEEIENNSFEYGVNFLVSKELIAELKKKYTEGE